MMHTGQSTGCSTACSVCSVLLAACTHPNFLLARHGMHAVTRLSASSPLAGGCAVARAAHVRALCACALCPVCMCMPHLVCSVCLCLCRHRLELLSHTHSRLRGGKGVCRVKGVARERGLAAYPRNILPHDSHVTGAWGRAGEGCVRGQQQQMTSHTHLPHSGYSRKAISSRPCKMSVDALAKPRAQYMYHGL